MDMEEDNHDRIRHSHGSEQGMLQSKESDGVEEEANRLLAELDVVRRRRWGEG